MPSSKYFKVPLHAPGLSELDATVQLHPSPKGVHGDIVLRDPEVCILATRDRTFRFGHKEANKVIEIRSRTQLCTGSSGADFDPSTLHPATLVMMESMASRPNESIRR